MSATTHAPLFPAEVRTPDGNVPFPRVKVTSQDDIVQVFGDRSVYPGQGDATSDPQVVLLETFPAGSEIVKEGDRVWLIVSEGETLATVTTRRGGCSACAANTPLGRYLP